MWIINDAIELTNPRPYNEDTSASPMLVQGDAMAHTWKVNMLKNGLPFSPDGYEVRAMFACADGNTVHASGMIGDGMISVVFPATVYQVSGRVVGYMRLKKIGDTTDTYITIAQRVFRVRDGEVGGVIADRDVMPSQVQLKESIDALDVRLEELEGRTTAVTIRTIGGLYFGDIPPENAPEGTVWIDTKAVG